MLGLELGELVENAHEVVLHDERRLLRVLVGGRASLGEHGVDYAELVRLASAASGARARSFHNMEAKPSGESTE